MGSHGHTKSPAMYGTIASEKDLKSKTEQLLHSWLKGHIERSKRGKDTVSHKREPHPQHSTHSWKQTGTPELLPVGQRLWTPHLTPHILRPIPERQASKVSSFDSLWILFPQDPQGYSYLGMQCKGRPKRASLYVKEAQLLIVKLWGLYYKWNTT